MTLLVHRELPLEQSAVLPRLSQWRLSGADGERGQPGPEPIDPLQPGPPEEDLLLGGGPQQGPLRPAHGPGGPGLPGLHAGRRGPHQPAAEEPLPPQPGPGARVPGASGRGAGAGLGGGGFIR